MARPPKIGLDYYNVDTDVFSDRKIRRLMKSGGMAAVGVWIFLNTEIYRDLGYYLNVSPDDIFDLSELLPIEEEELKDFIEQCVNVGLYESRLYHDQSVLTSEAIQKRYLHICKTAKRKKSNYMIRPDLMLLSEITGLSPDITGLTPVEMPQKKEKKIKGKERFENLEIFQTDYTTEFFKIVRNILGKELKYIGNASNETWLSIHYKIFTRVRIELASQNDVDKITNDHLVACFTSLIKSMDKFHKSNFTLEYLDKHFDKINSCMVAAQKTAHR